MYYCKDGQNRIFPAKGVRNNGTDCGYRLVLRGKFENVTFDSVKVELSVSVQNSALNKLGL